MVQTAKPATELDIQQKTAPRRLKERLLEWIERIVGLMAGIAAPRCPRCHARMVGSGSDVIHRSYNMTFVAYDWTCPRCGAEKRTFWAFED